MLTKLNINTPYPPDRFKDIYANVRDIKERFSERFGLEHYIGSSQDTTLATADGYHKQVTFYPVSEEPTVPTGGTIIYANKQLVPNSNVTYYIDLIVKNSTAKTYLTLQGQPITTDFKNTYGDGSYLRYAMKKIGNKYFAFGDKIWVSDDMVNWTAKLTCDGAIRDIASSDHYYTKIHIAVGDAVTYYSTDSGETWTKVTMTGVYFRSIVFSDVGSNYFTAVGYGVPYRTTDGITWTAHSRPATNATSSKVIYNLSMNIVTVNNVTNSYIAYSANCNIWGSQAMPNNVSELNGLCYANGLYVAVGSNKSIFTTTNVATTAWVCRQIDTSSSLKYYDVKYIDDKFIAVGDGIISYSTDGITWTDRPQTIYTSSYMRTIDKIDQYYVLNKHNDVAYTLNFP